MEGGKLLELLDRIERDGDSLTYLDCYLLIRIARLLRKAALDAIAKRGELIGDSFIDGQAVVAPLIVALRETDQIIKEAK